jgi:hypothetical protein
MALQIEVVSEERVSPSSRQGEPLRAPLSIIDATAAEFSPCEAVILYNHDPHSPSLLTPDHLRLTLQKTLDAYPQWCGRLHRSPYQPDTISQNHTLRYGRLFLTYGGSDDPGVLFLVAKADRPLAELVPNGQERATSASTWNAADFPLAQLVSQTPLSTKDLNDPSLPSVIIQVTTFACGGIAIALKFAHPLSDAHCMALFARDWAAVSRALLAGTELPRLSPVFNPQLLDKHAAGDIDAPHPDPQIVARAQSLPIHRYDWWISGHDCPFETLAKHIPKVLQTVPADPPGQRLPWSEWDVTAPVSHYLLHFSPSELERLWKNMSAATADRISRHDALLAHVWSCINRARRVGEEDEPVYLDYLLGLRTRTKPQLPPQFVGSPLLIAAISTSGREAATDHPSKLASLIRSTVAGFTPENVAAHLHAKAFEQSPVRFWEGFLGRRHVMVTSWVHTGMYQLDFGCGTPRYVQGVVPKIDGLLHIMEAAPSTSRQDSSPPSKHWADDGVDVQVHLETGSMDRLLRDPVLRKYRD